jgi:glycogen operon protein
VEGSTQDPQIHDLRMRQMKNMLTILLTSRGIPMLLAGDEFANSQQGNNNAYCQDNEVSWLDWADLKKNRELFDYVRHLIAFRKAHPVLRNMEYRLGHNGTGYPELSLHGEQPWQLDENVPALVFAYLYAEDHERFRTEADCFLYIAVNAHWEEHRMQLPIIPAGMSWKLAFDSAGFSAAPGEETMLGDPGSIVLGPRSIKVLVGAP